MYSGGSRWTKAFYRWLETQSLGHAAQQIVFQEYVDAVQAASQVVKTLEEDMVRALEDWSLEPVVRALRALRGVELVVGMTVMAELGDITRFDSPTQLMAYVGQVPSEHSTGRGRQGSITKTGKARAHCECGFEAESRLTMRGSPSGR